MRTGEAAFDAASGADFFTYLRDHPEAGAAFDGTMSALSLAVIAEAVASYDFGSAQRVLDIGGGRGHFATAVLLAHSRARCRTTAACSSSRSCSRTGPPAPKRASARWTSTGSCSTPPASRSSARSRCPPASASSSAARVRRTEGS